MLITISSLGNPTIFINNGFTSLFLFPNVTSNRCPYDLSHKTNLSRYNCVVFYKSLRINPD
jgi:hypothetical protein